MFLLQLVAAFLGVLCSILPAAPQPKSAEITATPASGTQWYVAPSGSSAGNGSVGSPWDLQTALNQPAQVRAGDTIWLRGGTYSGTFISRLTGTSTSPIVVRTYPGEWAVIDRAAQALMPTTLEVDGAWTWYWGFEITNSSPTRAISTVGSNPPDGRAQAITVYTGNNIKLINLIIHDSGNGIADQSGINNEIYGNVIYHNGWMGPDRGHGQGIYAQNQTGTKRIVDNVLFSGFGQGMQIYGSDQSYLNNFYIEGNIVFNSGILEQWYERNILVGGTGDCQSPYIGKNYSYYSLKPEFGPGAPLSVGYAAGCNNATLRDNYLVGTTAFIANKNLTMTGNTFGGAVQMDGGNTPSEMLSSYAGNVQIPYGTRPTGVYSFARANQYEAGRGQVAIFNWDGQASVNVDVSGILTVGSAYEVRDLQNLFGPAVMTGTYGGGTIAIPMSSTVMVAPVGTTPPYFHTNSDFGAFLILPPGVIKTRSALPPRRGPPTPVPSSPRPLPR